MPDPGSGMRCACGREAAFTLRDDKDLSEGGYPILLAAPCNEHLTIAAATVLRDRTHVVLRKV